MTLLHANDAERIARDFGPRLQIVLERLGWTCSELAARSCVDKSTLARIVAGETKPLLATFAKIVRAVADESTALAQSLFLNIYRSLTPESEVCADYNGDGKADRDDLVPICARLIDDTSGVFTATLDAIADGRVTHDEMLRVRQITAAIVDHCRALNVVIEGMNVTHTRVTYWRG